MQWRGDSLGTIQLKNAFHTAVNCSIMPTQTASDTSKMQVTIEEAQGAQSLKHSPVERNIVGWNKRLDWITWLLETNLTSTGLNTKFENSHFFPS